MIHSQPKTYKALAYSSAKLSHNQPSPCPANYYQRPFWDHGIPAYAQPMANQGHAQLRP
jgi:hypothetical protein